MCPSKRRGTGNPCHPPEGLAPPLTVLRGAQRAALAPHAGARLSTLCREPPAASPPPPDLPEASSTRGAAPLASYDSGLHRRSGATRWGAGPRHSRSCRRRRPGSTARGRPVRARGGWRVALALRVGRERPACGRPPLSPARVAAGAPAWPWSSAALCRSSLLAGAETSGYGAFPPARSSRSWT